MNQSKTITLDAVLRETILRDIKPTQTPNNKIDTTTEISLDTVLREAFRKDDKLNKLILSEQGAKEKPQYHPVSPYLSNPDWDYAKTHKSLGWNESNNGIPWTNTTAYATLKALGAQPFAVTKDKTKSLGSTNFIPSISTTVKRTTDPSSPTAEKTTNIGLQLQLYGSGTTPGTYAYFSPDGTMKVAGHENSWGWKLKSGKIYVTYLGPITSTYMGKALQWDEGYLEKRFGDTGSEVTFVDLTPNPEDVPKTMFSKELDPRVAAYLKQHSGNWDWYKTNKRDDYWAGALDRLNVVLDFVGIIFPPADAVNAVILLLRERYIEMLFSLIGLVPGVGDAIMFAGKSAVKGLGLLAKSITRLGKKAWVRIWKSMKKAGAADGLWAKINLYAKKAVSVMYKSGAIPKSTYDDFMQFLDEGNDAVKEYMKQAFAAKAAKRKTTELIRRYGINSSLKNVSTLKRLKNAFLRYAGGEGIKNILVGAPKFAWRMLTRDSTKSLKALYANMENKFIARLIKDPYKLALTMAGKAGKIGATSAKESGEKYIFGLLGQDFLNRMYKKNPNISNYINWATRPTQKAAGIIGSIKYEQLGNFLSALKLFSPADYKKIAQSIGADAAKLADETSNIFWDAYRASPLTELMTGAGFNTARFKSMINPMKWGGITDQLFSRDMVKRADIVYNELQEFNERQKLGSDIGGQLNQQSIIVFSVDEAWEELTGQSLFDFVEQTNKNFRNASSVFDKIQTQPPSRQPYGKPGFLDSTALQAYYDPTQYELPGSFNANKWLKADTKADIKRKQADKLYKKQ